MAGKTLDKKDTVLENSIKSCFKNGVEMGHD